jgi:light-regulated signal transduction histidine kinase (bacteriophytochrome)
VGSLLSRFFEYSDAQAADSGGPAVGVKGQTIQGAGALLMIDGPLRVVKGASERIGDYLGFGVSDLLGRSVDDLPISLTRAPDTPTSKDAKNHLLLQEGLDFDVVGHWRRDSQIVEFLPKPRQTKGLANKILRTRSEAMDAIASAPTPLAAMQLLSDAVAEITGFERTMVCAYSMGGHGEVLAETLGTTDLPSCLGKAFHNPEPQGLVDPGESAPHRAIWCLDGASSQKFISAEGPSHDLSRAFLSAASETHCDWLRSLGIASTFATTLVQNGQPWGQIMCHGTKGRSLGYDIWTTVSKLGRTAMARVAQDAERADHGRFRKVYSVDAGMASEVSRHGRAEDAIQSILPALMEFAQADGIAFVYGKQIFTSGRTPPDDFIDKLPLWALTHTADQNAFETISLQALLPEALPHFETACGILVRRIMTQHPCRLIWFRGPEPTPADWVGIPPPANGGSNTDAVPECRTSKPWHGIGSTGDREDLDTILSALATQLILIEENRDLKAITAELIQQQQHEALREFFASAVHDLKAPLRAIKFALDMMKEEHFDPQAVTDAYQIAETSGDRMVALTDSILTLADVQSTPLELAPIDTHALLENVRVVLSADMSSTNGHLELGDLPKIMGDRDQIARLFENVISNAIKYRAPDRPPIIQVTAETRGSSVRFTVSDNGLGIAEEDTSEIFKPMVRLHSKDQIEGVGLGLTICRGIVEAHGGEIMCEPRDPHGLRIVFDLPAYTP